MPVNISVKNVPDELARRLRARAQRHHRSLQGELVVIFEEAVREEEPLSPAELLATIRQRGPRTHEEAARAVREDRDGR
jgi:plasmid stability protein